MADDPLHLVGTTIADKYAIESVVGAGGFALVYRAQHKLWKRPVALKVFRALGEVPEAQRQKLLEEFIREGALLAELSEKSTAIVQARDIGMLTVGRFDLPYMVLEWLEGATLEGVLADENARGVAPRTIDEAVRLLEPVAEALAIAHARGIAHRDVKPANVFVLGDARGATVGVKLLDFGIAKVVSDAQKMAGGFSKTTGMITAFTPAYGAPEQFNRSFGATGPWTDVYALALVVVETITGREPVEGNDVVQLAIAAADPARRPTPRARGAAVSDDVERVLARAVAVAPSERQPDAGAFWNELRAALRMDPMRAATLPPAALAATALAPVGPAGALESARTLVDPRGAPPAAPPHAATTIDPPPPAPRPRAAAGLALGALVALGASVAAVLAVTSRAHAPRAAPSASIAFASARGAAPPSASAAPPSPCPPGMIHVPGGMFFMGSDEPDAIPSEKPAHQVILAPYCIDELEVTVARYKACSDDGSCKPDATFNDWPGITPKDREIYDPLCNRRDPVARAGHPMNCVDWQMAEAFCEHQGARLPTEAEWEFAARGPDGRKYPWGDEPPSAERLNACGAECARWGKEHGLRLEPMYDADDGYPNTSPVGAFGDAGASRYGLKDVVGNVWEWTGDWFGAYPSSAAHDPKGPAAGEERVVRGGAWNGTSPSWVRPSYRFPAAPHKRSSGIGMRCAKSL